MKIIFQPFALRQKVVIVARNRCGGHAATPVWIDDLQLVPAKVLWVIILVLRVESF